MYPFVKLFLSGIVLLFLFAPVFGQLDSVHYFPPIYQGNGTANQGALYISTPSLTPVSFQLTDGAGTLVASGTVSNTNYYRYQMNGVNATILLPSSQLNTPLTGKGFIVHASAPVYANLRYEAVNNNQSFSITAKGRKALGQSFRIAHAKADAASFSNSEVTLMATENNTQITIDLTGTSLVLLGTAPPSTATPIVVTLNKGQSYVFAINNSTNGANRWNMLGKLITSNRPIVAVMGNYLGCFASGNHDIGLDQLVSEELLGTQYAFLQGLGGTDKEKVLLVANQNNTDVFLNGAAVPIATLNAGDHLEIAGTNYNADSVMFVQTSQPVYAWQIIFGTNSYANWGLNFVPPISCLNERFVDFIPAIDSVGTQKFTGNLNIITFAGSSLLVNGVVPAALPRPIPGSTLEAYRIHGLTGSFRVTSNSIAVVGFYGRNGPSTYAGYFSGFDSIPEIQVSLTDSICPDSLFITDRFDSYQWLYNNSQIPSATDTFLPLNSQIGTFNVIVSKGTCVDTSGTYTVNCILPYDNVAFSSECKGSSEWQFSWNNEPSEGAIAFEVEGSEFGLRWATILSIQADLSRRNYLKNIRVHDPGLSYFRLKGYFPNGEMRVSEMFYQQCGESTAGLICLPNPTEGRLQVLTQGFGQSGLLEVWDMNGRLVRNTIVSEGTATILELPKGVFMVVVTGEGVRKSMRVVVE